MTDDDESRDLLYRCSSCGREVDDDPPPDRCRACVKEEGAIYEEPAYRKLRRLGEVVISPSRRDSVTVEILELLFHRVMILERELGEARGDVEVLERYVGLSNP